MSARLRSAPAAALVDAIYEAAFSPENWIDVLAQGRRRKRFGLRPANGFRRDAPGAIPRHRRRPRYYSGGRQGDRAAQPESGLHAEEPVHRIREGQRLLPPQLLNDDPGHARRLAVGLESEASAVIPMPTGEMVVFSFDRWQREGPHGEEDLAALNAFYPHLARSALIASRLGLERAVTATSTLQMIGVPATVLTGSGRVLASNSFFDQLTDVFLRARSTAWLSPIRGPTASSNKLWIRPKGQSGPFQSLKRQDGRPASFICCRFVETRTTSLGGDILIAVTS